MYNFKIGDVVRIRYSCMIGIIVGFKYGLIAVMFDSDIKTSFSGHDCDGLITDYPNKKGWFFSDSDIEKRVDYEMEQRAEKLLNGELIV